MTTHSIHIVAAARPNFMKVAPLYHALAAEPWCEPKIVHTGQHYDANMSDAFFRDLGLPDPHFHLGVGSGSHAEQTANVMIAFEAVCVAARPDWVIVAGDVNSTIACALVASKLWIPVAHLEAGLRSGDRRMPEEINRILTDAISDLLWTPSIDGNENLAREGISSTKIDLVGNIMIDSYTMMQKNIAEASSATRFDVESGRFGVVTLHRPSNVDDERTLRSLIEQLLTAAELMPLVFTVHPRTRKSIEAFGLSTLIGGDHRLRLTEPLGYVEFMSLVRDAAFVLTDSGGLQEETTYLRIPCITLRENTERPTTVTLGTNRLARPGDVLGMIEQVARGEWPVGVVPDLWDGRTAPRVVESLRRRLV